jgi:dTDP-4-amino-4,6-dideoxygalactose transaminase
MRVPFANLQAQNAAIKAELWPVWEAIFDAAGFIGGEQVDRLEEEFAAACQAAHCVAVSNGTDALRFIFLALGLRPGDEVITVPNTFIATTEAISQAGGMPTFVDVDPATYTMDPARIEAAITPRTRGIVPVHLYGQPADMDAIRAVAERHGLWVVEDACQAHLAEYKGRRAGSLARAAAFSFYPGKNLGACGEGGAVTTDDPALAARIRMLRDHGQAKKYYHDIEGYNGRLGALQCAALRIKLKHLPAWTDARRRHAARYAARLADTPVVMLPRVADGCRPVHHLYVVQVDDRDRVAERLNAAGVGTGLHYPIPLHRQKAYAWRGIPDGSFPVSERAATRILSLPMFPELTEEQIDFVCASLTSAVR